MKFLRESYTEEEVKQRVLEVRDSMSELRSNLYTLLTSLEDTNKYKAGFVQDFLDVIEDYQSEYVDELDNIVTDNINLKLVDNDFIGYIKKIKDMDSSLKIKQLKEKLKTVTDINEQTKIMDQIIKLKKDGE